MAQPPGRREAHKLATRQALQQAADRLFAERGYGATTVRDIAGTAGVTERTFFRYFAGKEELILDDALGWLPVLLHAIRDRPAHEDVGTALHQAFRETGALLSASPRPAPVWPFSDGPPGARTGRMPAGTLLRIETSLAEAIRERLERTHPDVADPDYVADLLSRIVLAMIRSAMIRHAQLSRDPGQEAVPASVLVDQALSILSLPGSPVPPGGSPG